MSYFRLFALSSVLVATAGNAASDPQAGNAAAAKIYADYMNQRVCESITVTGSRLGARRFCATRAEWAERRLQDRQATDTLQTQLCAYTHSSASGKPSC